MINENYIRHLSVLGKLAYIYDQAVAGVEAENTLLSTFVDQYADGTKTTVPAVILFPQYTAQLNQTTINGAATRKSIALAAAAAYLINPTFTAGLTTTPTATTAVAVLTALQTEMGAGEDDKTLTTLDTTGLVNFFNAILVANGGEAGTWNTEADESADYKDSVYVVATLVE